ncbi:AMP-binding protein [Hyphobacterium marinum]|uniref:AMP-binding protein n=1 Tax=Hyphobacterium marinum TaxID=3116574 RepID=A0ABU7LVT6_9PROT|nr:AMP-binding protein [Hyphobacterium sp. Y6023]MEE2565673.1 AMP-binding protein [Hyphobacterium sp. Y6023]
MDFLTDIAARRAALTPDRTAFTDVKTGRSMTYRAFNNRAARAAQVLVESGVTAGSRVVILCRNRVEFFEILMACGKIGAILVPLNWRMPAAELTPLIADCGPALIIHGQEDRETALALAGEAGIAALDLDQPGGYPDRVAAAEPLAGRERWPSGETWYLIYTSGTTGQPKGVIQTYGMALVNYLNISQAIGLRDGDATLNFLPLFHTAGINLHTLPVLIAGGHVQVLPGFEAGAMLDLIETGGIDVFIGVPAIYRELSLHPRFESVDLSKVRHWACGGAPLPDTLVERFAARGPRVCNGFGMTETGPTAFLSDPEAATAKIGSVGKPQLFIDARIAKPDGALAGDEETGEIQFSGPGMTPGYWNRPEETKALFTDDGWLKSGDLGRRDADGYVYVVGRIKEMYISGGENVYPAEVENVLASHPAVFEAAVVGEPSEKWGETGCAHVELKPGQAATADELKTWCRTRLAAFKVPARFVFSDTLPRTAAGKVQKHLLPREGQA